MAETGYTWGEQDAATREAVEQEIAGFCVNELENAHLGEVIGPDGRAYGVRIVAKLEPCPVKQVCSYCGSSNVSCDAAARWDEVTQTWSVTDIFDEGSCDDCGESGKRVIMAQEVD